MLVFIELTPSSDPKRKISINAGNINVISVGESGNHHTIEMSNGSEIYVQEDTTQIRERIRIEQDRLQRKVK